MLASKIYTWPALIPRRVMPYTCCIARYCCRSNVPHGRANIDSVHCAQIENTRQLPWYTTGSLFQYLLPNEYNLT